MTVKRNSVIIFILAFFIIVYPQLIGKSENISTISIPLNHESINVYSDSIIKIEIDSLSKKLIEKTLILKSQEDSLLNYVQK